MQVESGLIHEVVSLLMSNNAKLRNEAVWAVSNAASSGSPTDIAAFVRCGCIPPLVAILSIDQDNKSVVVVLEGALGEPH